MLKRFCSARLLWEFLVGFLVLFIVLNLISYLRAPRPDTATLPSWRFESLTGEMVDFAGYQGEPVVVHFWTTWCPVCRMEVESIDRLAKDYRVVTIVVDSGTDSKVVAWMRAREISFLVINDTDLRLSKAMDVTAFPTTFIFDAKGSLRFAEVGYTSYPGLLARLKWIDTE
jgi:thiol-disulfide isomerase/thioredoxin